jgi:hypothetical protein
MHALTNTKQTPEARVTMAARKETTACVRWIVAIPSPGSTRYAIALRPAAGW